MMKLKRKIGEAGLTGYILLWLLGIPIPILLLSSCCGAARNELGSK
jgi:hypothetical protein